jgi:hypothetical protein
MHNVQKHNNCINIQSSQPVRSYPSPTSTCVHYFLLLFVWSCWLCKWPLHRYAEIKKSVAESLSSSCNQICSNFTHPSIFSKVLFSLMVLLVDTAESGSVLFHWSFYRNGFSNSVFTYIIMQRARRLEVLMVVTTKIKLSSEMLYYVAFVEIPMFCRNLLPVSSGQTSVIIQLHHSH